MAWTVFYNVAKPGLTEQSFTADRNSANSGTGYIEKLQQLRDNGTITSVTQNYGPDQVTIVTTWASEEAYNLWAAELATTPIWNSFRVNLNNLGYDIMLDKYNV